MEPKEAECELNGLSLMRPADSRGVDLDRAEPRIGPWPRPFPIHRAVLLCRSACSSFCEPGLDQVPDQTPIALCEREFICKASFQKYSDTVMTC
jgi:hypothetical protein